MDAGQAEAIDSRFQNGPIWSAPSQSSGGWVNRFFIDTEFTRLEALQLISVAVVGEKGAEFYGECTDYDVAGRSDFVRAVAVTRGKVGLTAKWRPAASVMDSSPWKTSRCDRGHSATYCRIRLYSTRHQRQDEDIAGPNASAVLSTPEDCGCPDDEGKKRETTNEFPVLGPAPRDATDGASKAPRTPFDELEGATKRAQSVFAPRSPDGDPPSPSPTPIPLFW